MTKYYPESTANPEFPRIEEKILSYWNEKKLFEKSVEARPTTNHFVFYDGPPFANGLPHYGHLLTGFVKDTIARYQTMRGKRVERRFGWDCHGLPAEMGAEKELGISGRLAITNFGIDKFNDHCRSSVMRYRNEWRDYVERQARWVDFDNDYKTMDISYMESVIWAFKELYKKGLIYQSMRVMPYSWACETPLSNFETRMDNSYRERADKAVTVAFKLKERPKALANYDCRILAWTTTPWTLPSNLALAIGELKYVAVVKDNICYILAASSLKAYEKELGSEVLAELTSDELVGLTYEPLFPYFKNHENSFKVLKGHFVVEGDGTGVVHIAPGFGEDDQLLCEANGIKLVCPVDTKGCFTKEVSDFAGMQVFDANDEIIKRLKLDGSWIKTEQYLHNYPHCWRTDTPLIYRAVSSWYVKVTDIKDKMLKANSQINWIPEHIKDGLFGKWLENARDWSISRNRFWGTPIPIWMSDDAAYPRIDVYGSIEELEKDFGVKINDLHRPFIDELTRPNPDDPTGKSKMVRVEDVFDCWFESGSMPYAQNHYPFENKEKFENNFPADFIVEYTGQTRGWFYTLIVLSAALFDRPPFLNCICHGLILDATGQKLSKRLNNYADPKDLFNKYGADAIRFLMLSSPVLKGQELLIDKEGNMVKDTLRLVIKPIWNAYNFFTLYANADEIKGEFDLSSDNMLDKYIISKLHLAVKSIINSLDNYDIPTACNEINDFFEILNNWYIRRNRHRFWKNEKDDDKISAYNTLYSVLVSIIKVAAPLLPLITEEIYISLTGKESVHLGSVPDYNIIPFDNVIIEKMDYIRQICSAALAIRNTENIRIRMPLSSLQVVGKNAEIIFEFEDLIKDELNVKQILTSSNIEEIANFKLKINFPVLGKRLPTKVKDVIAASKTNEWRKEGEFLSIAGEKLLPEEFELVLEARSPKGTATLPSNEALVILDLNITKELEAEGNVRDLVRAIQQARKDKDLDISDKIDLYIDSSKIDASFAGFIGAQTLANVNFGSLQGEYQFSEEIDGEVVKFGFSVGKGY